ncbi:LysR family transcriptional regulator [Streptomyces canus]|uniref:LysR family transcriptional regulator n=1 Tax=Streptomyces canus TaxID=58343 RepID=UPI00277D71E3|nr:LysR family transcriptional regulator [Streptomyces canus]MDQ0767235.1 DNA-binding transcriptional LysR family regulator [Streptomyces canus]
MIDVKRLVILRDLAEYGKVSIVAGLHGVTSSAISQQLRALEAEADAALVYREGRGVQLTAAGSALAAECEHVLAALERAEGAVRALDDDLSGELSIGCAPSALTSVAAPLVAALAALHPGLRPKIIQAEPEDAVLMLKQHSLDLTVSYRYHLLGTKPPSGTTAVELFHDPLRLAVPEHLREAVGREGLGVLRDRAWISAPEPSSCREILLHACRNAGFTARIEHNCDDLRSALSLVATGLAVTILPGLLCDAPPAGTAILPLPDPGRTIEALVRSGTESHPVIAATLAVSTRLAKKRPPTTPPM